MTNLQRLEMEVKGIDLSEEELQIYLMESDLTPHEEYNANSKKAIHKSALSILESIANQPTLMKNYRHDDMTISDFAEHIQSRIDQLERKVRQMKTTDEDTSFFMLFNG